MANAPHVMLYLSGGGYMFELFLMPGFIFAPGYHIAIVCFNGDFGAPFLESQR